MVARASSLGCSFVSLVSLVSLVSFVLNEFVLNENDQYLTTAPKYNPFSVSDPVSDFTR